MCQDFPDHPQQLQPLRHHELPETIEGCSKGMYTGRVSSPSSKYFARISKGAGRVASWKIGKTAL